MDGSHLALTGQIVIRGNQGEELLPVAFELECMALDARVSVFGILFFSNATYKMQPIDHILLR